MVKEVSDCGKSRAGGARSVVPGCAKVSEAKEGPMVALFVSPEIRCRLVSRPFVHRSNGGSLGAMATEDNGYAVCFLLLIGY